MQLSLTFINIYVLLVIGYSTAYFWLINNSCTAATPAPQAGVWIVTVQSRPWHWANAAHAPRKVRLFLNPPHALSIRCTWHCIRRDDRTTSEYSDWRPNKRPSMARYWQSVVRACSWRGGLISTSPKHTGGPRHSNFWRPSLLSFWVLLNLT